MRFGCASCDLAIAVHGTERRRLMGFEMTSSQLSAAQVLFRGERDPAGGVVDRVLEVIEEVSAEEARRSRARQCHGRRQSADRPSPRLSRAMRSRKRRPWLVRSPLEYWRSR